MGQRVGGPDGFFGPHARDESFPLPVASVTPLANGTVHVVHAPATR